MSVSKIKGFLSWQFSGTLKNPSFYGLIISVLGTVAVFVGCPAPWPFAMNIAGMIIIMVDLAYFMLKSNYKIYQSEQDRIMRELERK